MKILAGVYRADEGEIWLRGEKVTGDRPARHDRRGRERHLPGAQPGAVPLVAENIFLGREPRRAGGFIDWKRMWAEVKRLLEPFGLSLDPRVRVNTLGPRTAGGRDREGPLAPNRTSWSWTSLRRAHRSRGGPPLRGDP